MSQQSPHIIRDFDDAMQALREEVLRMASQTRLNLERAFRALSTRDLDLCKAVIADDNDVDEMERNVDAAGMDILVRFHPVASDLRLVISSMKVVTNLERISDHAVNIAKRAKKMVNRNEVPETKLLEPLSQMATSMLADALTAYADRNAELGGSLFARDKELDRQHKRVVRGLSQLLEEGGPEAEAYLHLIFVARSFERVGDLAVNIGEDAVFLDLARDIRYGHDGESEK
jgi:phosphate transport system protein